MFSRVFVFLIATSCSFGALASEQCTSLESCDDVTLAIAAQITAAQNICTRLDPQYSSHYADAVNKLIAAEADEYEKAKTAPVFAEAVQLLEAELSEKPQEKLLRECKALLRKHH